MFDFSKLNEVEIHGNAKMSQINHKTITVTCGSDQDFDNFLVWFLALDIV